MSQVGFRIASKELTSERGSRDQDAVELLQSFFKAVEAFFFIYVVLIANLVLRLLLDICTTALLVVAPVEELHNCSRKDNAHRICEEKWYDFSEIVMHLCPQRDR